MSGVGIFQLVSSKRESTTHDAVRYTVLLCIIIVCTEQSRSAASKLLLCNLR